MIANKNKEILNILIPMAGMWSRFKIKWYKLPKPLIKVKWKPMFYWALSSFNFLKSNYYLQYIFIVLKEHILNYQIDNYIKNIVKNPIIVAIDTVTRWQLETSLKAKKYINNSTKLIVFNSDTYTIFDENNFPLYDNNINGLITCFNSSNRNYSYVRTNREKLVLEVAEKKVISNYATNWMYYFNKWKLFVKYGEQMIKDNNLFNWEFYVWPLYNFLINDNKVIKMSLVKENWILWTPEELDYFNKNYNK